MGVLDFPCILFWSHIFKVFISIILYFNVHILFLKSWTWWDSKYIIIIIKYIIHLANLFLQTMGHCCLWKIHYFIISLFLSKSYHIDNTTFMTIFRLFFSQLFFDIMYILIELRSIIATKEPISEKQYHDQYDDKHYIEASSVLFLSL